GSGTTAAGLGPLREMSSGAKSFPTSAVPRFLSWISRQRWWPSPNSTKRERHPDGRGRRGGDGTDGSAVEQDVQLLGSRREPRRDEAGKQVGTVRHDRHGLSPTSLKSHYSGLIESSYFRWPVESCSMLHVPFGLRGGFCP